MLGKTKTSDTSQTGQRCLYPAPSLLFQEPAGQGESRQCGPSGYASPGPQLWINPSSLIGHVSVQSNVLLIGTGSQTEK